MNLNIVLFSTHFIGASSSNGNFVFNVAPTPIPDNYLGECALIPLSENDANDQRSQALDLIWNQILAKLSENEKNGLSDTRQEQLKQIEDATNDSEVKSLISKYRQIVNGEIPFTNYNIESQQNESLEDKKKRRFSLYKLPEVVDKDTYHAFAIWQLATSQSEEAWTSHLFGFIQKMESESISNADKVSILLFIHDGDIKDYNGTSFHCKYHDKEDEGQKKIVKSLIVFQHTHPSIEKLLKCPDNTTVTSKGLYELCLQEIDSPYRKMRKLDADDTLAQHYNNIG